MKLNHIVIAGNYDQYYLWVRENQLNPREYKYIGTVECIRGMDNMIIYEVGDYYKNEVWEYLHSTMFYAEKVEQDKYYQYLNYLISNNINIGK